MNKHFDKYVCLYLAIILFILGMFFYSRAYACEADLCEYNHRIYALQHPVAIKHVKMLEVIRIAYDNCKTNADKVQFHKENGDRCLNDAKNKCWWLPDLDDREKARYCFTNIGVLVCPGDPKSKLIISIVTTLIQYGLDCSEQWHYINNKLYWAQYHYEMMEFYEDLIKHGHE